MNHAGKDSPGALDLREQSLHLGFLRHIAGFGQHGNSQRTPGVQLRHQPGIAHFRRLSPPGQHQMTRAAINQPRCDLHPQTAIGAGHQITSVRPQLQPLGLRREPVAA